MGGGPGGKAPGNFMILNKTLFNDPKEYLTSCKNTWNIEGP